MGKIYQAYGVDMDLQHGAIVHVTARINADRFEVMNVNAISTYETSFGKDTPTLDLVAFARSQATRLSPYCLDLGIEWDRNRVYYRGARKSAVVQAATMIGAFLGACPQPRIQDFTPAMKARVLKPKVTNWIDFTTESQIHLVNPDRYDQIDEHSDIADATAVAIYYIKTQLLGEDL